MIQKVAIIQNIRINDHRMVHTDGIARELVKKGFIVDVIIQESSEVSQFAKINYNLVNVPGDTYSIFGQLKFMFWVFLWLRAHYYDIIHAKNPFSSVLPALLTRNDGKVIYDIRGLWIDFGVHSKRIPFFIASLLWRIDLWCMRNSDMVIAISEELKKELVSRGLDDKHVNVIVGAGVAFDDIIGMEPNDIRDYLGIDGEVVGYVGGIGRSRSSEKIIMAFKYVNDFIPSSKLVMIGPIVNKCYFNDLVYDLNLKEKVFFTGFIPHQDALRFIKSFNVAVSYHEENIPIFNVAVPTKILEYLACGCSIVTTNHKMYRTLLTHEKDGYLTDENPESFSNGIINILVNKKLSTLLSTFSIQSAEKYSFNNITQSIIKTYDYLNYE